mgnify:CR=1 FL=1
MGSRCSSSSCCSASRSRPTAAAGSPAPARAAAAADARARARQGREAREGDDAHEGGATRRATRALETPDARQGRGRHRAGRGCIFIFGRAVPRARDGRRKRTRPLRAPAPARTRCAPHMMPHRAALLHTRDEELATTRQRVQRLPLGGGRLRSTAKITLDVATEIRHPGLRGLCLSAYPPLVAVTPRYTHTQ